MDDRRTASIVGLLFIAATGFYIAGQVIHSPILGASGVLGLSMTQKTWATIGVLIELLGILAIPLIAVFIFPVLRRHSVPFALTYLVLRIVESTLLILVAAFGLALVLHAGGPTWVDLRDLVQVLGEPAFLLSVGIVFPLSALVLNGVLWRTGIVPVGISLFGLIAGALLMVGTLIDLLGLMPNLPPAAVEVVFSGPIALQEMVLAIWLITKGFSPEALARMDDTLTPERWGAEGRLELEAPMQ
ncbi:MAG: DUF4386 domain-containing protein [Longimicrobiales bacterium]